MGRGRKAVGVAERPARSGLLAGAAGRGFCLGCLAAVAAEQHGLWKSYLLASLTLKVRKAFGQGLLPLAWGAMHADVRWDKRFPLNLRVEGFLEAVKASCERTGQEIVRLIHADALMARGIDGKRKASKLPQLKDLLLGRPLVSARMIQRVLKVSPEGASYLLKQLGPGPREVTGQRSYRVWGI